jgi:hypothetical protein
MKIIGTVLLVVSGILTGHSVGSDGSAETIAAAVTGVVGAVPAVLHHIQDIKDSIGK